MSLIIGIDPDSQAHGVAYWKDEKLIDITTMTLMDIVNTFLVFDVDCTFSVEHVEINKPIFAGKKALNFRSHGRKGQNVGQCKQAQIELVRALDYYKAKYILIPPTKGNWGSCKTPAITKAMTNQFKKVTGWQGRSNSDTRSAAFFGFLAINRLKQP